MADDYGILWEPFEIGNMTLRNRISMAPMGTFTPMQDGTDSEEGMRYYEERAKGGHGLIMTGAMFLNTELAQGSPTIAVDNHRCIPKTTVLVERVHRWGAKICLQISPGTGRNTVLGDMYDEVPVSASEVPAFYDPSITCRPLTVDEIKQTMEEWKVAATFALRCGFDAVEIHAHAGYLIDQFLSPIWNKRKDQYGGSFENRCRFALETVDAIRSVVGPKFPILFRISLDHRFNGGRTLEDSMSILEVLDRSGIDAFDVDAGSYETIDYIFPTSYTGDACMAYVCQQARKHLTKPIINAGNHTMETAVQLLKSGQADLVHFGRQSIADPHFANKLKQGRRQDVRPCIVCNQECIGRIFGRLTQLSCAVNPAAGLEAHMEVTKLPRPRQVVVIGAGPCGLEAARCAAERGCNVSLYEKEGRIGGTLFDIATPDFKQRLRQLISWYQHQLQKLGVKLILNTEIGAHDPVLESADAIFVATGSDPVRPNIPGLDDEKVIDVISAHKQGLPEGETVVICGGGLSACDAALEFAPKGRKITIVEMLPELARDVMSINAVSIFRLLDQYGVKQLTNTEVVGITSPGVEVLKKDGSRDTIPADVVVTAFGQQPNTALAAAIQKKFPTRTTAIGDCIQPAKVGTAIRQGFYAAMLLQ